MCSDAICCGNIDASYWIEEIYLLAMNIINEAIQEIQKNWFIQKARSKVIVSLTETSFLFYINYVGF